MVILKIDAVSESVRSNLKFLKMIFVTEDCSNGTLAWINGILSSVLGLVGFRAFSRSMLRTRSNALVTIELGQPRSAKNLHISSNFEMKSAWRSLGNYSSS